MSTRPSLDERIAIVLERMVSSEMGSVTVNSLAESMNLSTSRLRHLFREQVGTSFHSYEMLLRLERVRLVLRTTDCSVKEAARMVGFKDMSNFIRRFKRTYGATPRSLRANDLAMLERSDNARFD